MGGKYRRKRERVKQGTEVYVMNTLATATWSQRVLNIRETELRSKRWFGM